MTEDTNSNTNTTSKSSSTPSLPWKTRLILSISSAITDTSRRSNGTVNRRLLNFLDFRSPPTPNNPIDGVKSSDVTVDLTRKLWFRLFIPASSAATSLPVLVFFHGGGFTFLSPASKSYDAACRNFATAIPAIVVSVNYRLSPEHRYPSQYDDAFDVLNFLDEQSNSNLLPENADLSRCFLAGDSAGANLAHNSAVRACQNKYRVLKVIGLIAIQPFFGGEERTESEIRLIGSPLVNLERTDWLWKAFLPDGSNRDHEASNVSGPNAMDISGLDFPSTVVFVGGLDPLQDWQRRYYQWLKKCGKEAQLIEYPNMIHAFYVFPELPESKQLIAQVKDFVASLPIN